MAPLSLAVACGFDGGTAASGGVGSGSSGDTTNAAASSTMTTTTASSASGSNTTTTAGTTAAGTTAATTDGTGGSTGGDSTGPAVNPPVTLSNVDQNNCNGPFWCIDGAVTNPGGGPTAGAECFTSPLPPPFELTRVGYRVWGSAPQLGAVRLEVRGFNGAPTQPIDFFPLVPEDVTPGQHDFVFSPPLMINAQQFCVGLNAPGQGLAGALGVAVDVGTSVQDVSWVRLPGCVGNAFVDIMDLAAIDPGNWCVEVDVREP